MDGTSIATHETVVFILLPERGAFNASFALARQLAMRGRHVVYLGPSAFSEHVTAQGLEYRSVAMPKYESLPAEVRFLRKPREKRQQAIFGYTAYREVLSAVAGELRALAPAVALIDPLMWRYAPPLLELNIPIVGLNTTLASWFQTDVPPVFSDIVPPKGNRPARMQNLRAWSPILIKHRWRALIEDVTRAFWLGPFKAPKYRARSLIARRGAKLVIGEYGPRLAVPELVMSPEELDFPAAAHSGKRIYLGSSVDTSRVDCGFDWSVVSEARPILYCSLGTYSKAYPAARKLFEAVIDAFRDRLDWTVIVQIGEVAEIESFGDLPDHIIVAKSTPQLEILARASLFITHGGFSSTREAIFFGVPTIVFPCWLDQPGNAARVVFHGLGVRGDINRVSGEMIGQLVTEAESESIRERIRAMSEIFRAQEHCSNGAEWIDKNFPSRHAGDGNVVTLHRLSPDA